MARTRLTPRKRTPSSLTALGCLAPRRNQEEDALEAVPEAPQEMPQEESELEEIPLEDPMEQDLEEYMPEDSTEQELEEHIPVASGNEDSLFGDVEIFLFFWNRRRRHARRTSLTGT